MLVYTGQLDSWSARPNVEAALPGLSGASYFEVPGQTHNVMGFTDCSIAMRNAWLDDPAKPPPDTSSLARLPRHVHRRGRRLSRHPGTAGGRPRRPRNPKTRRMTDEPSLYDAAGGMAFFEALVGRFYEGVEADPVLRPIYPEADLAGARHRLTLFLAQYWGGPTTYDAERGHPRLRMRHAPFAIGPAERDAWLARMREAVA